MQAMAACGRTVIPWDATLPLWQRRCTTLLSRLFYGSREIPRLPVRRWWQAARMAKKWRTLSPHSAILHTHIFSLPASSFRCDLRHYLYCDATWILQQRNAPSEVDRQPRLMRVIQQLDDRTYSQTKHIFSISEYVRDHLISDYGIPLGKVSAVGTGWGAIQPYNEAKPQGRLNFLFVAKERFVEKGGVLVVESFKRVFQEYADIHLTIVGGACPYRQQDLPPNITLLGHVSWDRLQRLFAESHVFVMPAFYEPWGLVYLEAMVSAMPVIGLDRNSLPELTDGGRDGFMLRESTAEALAALLVQIHKNPAVLSEMGRRAQQRCCARYTWAHTAERILEIIDR